MLLGGCGTKSRIELERDVLPRKILSLAVQLVDTLQDASR
jgi:hypothetical protein